MKTALQGLIEELEMMYEDQFNENEKLAIKNCLIATNSYLETEKQQIIEAYNQGYRDGESETLVASNEDVSKFDDAINYYNETFNNQ